MKIDAARLARYIAAARDAGCPGDQVDRFVRGGYIASPAQLKFHAAARACDRDAGATDLAMGGSRGGMKSHAILAQAGIDDCQRINGLKFLFLRKTERAASESFEDLVNRVFKNTKYDFSDGCIMFPETGSKIVVGGYKNDSDIDKYIGIEYDGLIVEERTQIPQRKLDKLYGSIRTSKPNWRPRKYSSTNPGGPAHVDFVSRFVKPFRDGREADTRFFQTSYKDNPFLDSAYKKYLDELPGKLGEAWREGNWDVWEGQFFTEFDIRLEEPPFIIPLSDSQGRLIGSLDSGTSHATSFGLWYIDQALDVHRLMSVRTQGISIRASAEEIFDRLDSFPFTYSAFPSCIVYDNQMDTGARLNDNDTRAPIDEYKEVFKKSNQLITWEPANKRKENGCQILRMLFTGTSEMKPMKYFSGYNQSFVEGIQRVNTDENNAEVYEKAPGDDEADEARYGAVKVFSGRGVLSSHQKNIQPKTHLQELLTGKYRRKPAFAEDWYHA